MTWEEEFWLLWGEATIWADENDGLLKRKKGEAMQSFIQKTREEAVREALEDMHTLLHNGKIEEAYRLCCYLIIEK